MAVLHQVKDRLYLAQNIRGLTLDETKFRKFQPTQALVYHAYCDDFGPVCMAAVVDFVKLLDAELAKFPDANIVFLAPDGKRALTNAVFLLGAYMILKIDMTPTNVELCFRWLDHTSLESYRDATFASPTFRLRLIDCWRGLGKGMEHGWVRYGADGYMWGDIDVDEYRHNDSPVNGNLTMVVPDKFVAFQGPKDLGGAEYLDNARGGRDFSPAYYAAILSELGVGTVVRLNEPLYAAEDLTSRGFVHVDLEFDDCTCPPDAIVEAFLRAADAEPGAVAVHCKAGLGRTGTLIALYMMRSRGFTAREAMGWLRIMRPGSVIGQQQQYLVDVEAALAALPRSSVSFDSSSDVSAAADVAGSATPGQPGSLLVRPSTGPTAQAARTAAILCRIASAPVGGDAGGAGSAGRECGEPDAAAATASAAAASAAAAELAMQVEAGRERRAASATAAAQISDGGATCSEGSRAA